MNQNKENLYNHKKDNRSPLSSYHGGKFFMSSYIINKIPKHQNYIEPFFGAGTVLFSKKRSPYEIINDLDDRLYRFWKCTQTNSYEMFKRLENFIFFEKEYIKAFNIITGKQKPKDEIEFAISVFIYINCSFNKTFPRNNKIDSIKTRAPLDMENKIHLFNNMMLRLKKVTILNRDALDIIKKFDNYKSFFYLDPPYPSSYQEYKHKFSIEDFNKILEILKSIKGKFILSCYNNPDFQFDPKWKTEIKTIKLGSTANKHKIRNEFIVWNF